MNTTLENQVNIKINMHRNNISVANMTFKKTSKRKLEWRFSGMISVLNFPHEHNIRKTPLRSIRFSWSSRGYDLSGVSPGNQQTTTPNIQPAIKTPYENTISFIPDCNMGNSLVVYNGFTVSFCVLLVQPQLVHFCASSEATPVDWGKCHASGPEGSLKWWNVWGLLFHKGPPRFLDGK